MSPFKEPQPRKNSAAEDAKKVIGGNWPPYAREGGEANWTSKGEPVALEVPNTAEAAQFQEVINEALREQQQQRTANEYYSQTPLMVVPDHTPFMARSAALEAAVKYVGNQSIEYTAQGTVALADIFENYLKNGKPA